ncbi:hypothetical protein F4780DRAFT_798264 [Xylariomycetidae sp. FL0641]|nr:hypothetical protein F4780DRAFT_798264 [Xylariomycetidae sp. FL0641]
MENLRSLNQTLPQLAPPVPTGGSGTKTKRPTPTSLPKLVIKPYSEYLPEEVLSGEAEDLINFGVRYQQAPTTHSLSLSQHDVKTPDLSEPEEEHPDPYEETYSPVPSLQFTQMEEYELEDREDLKEVLRAEHTAALAELRRDVTSEWAKEASRRLTKKREENSQEIQKIYEKRRIRREFRAEVKRMLRDIEG